MVYDSEEILADSTLERLKASKIKKKKKGVGFSVSPDRLLNLKCRQQAQLVRKNPCAALGMTLVATKSTPNLNVLFIGTFTFCSYHMGKYFYLALIRCEVLACIRSLCFSSFVHKYLFFWLLRIHRQRKIQYYNPIIAIQLSFAIQE